MTSIKHKKTLESAFNQLYNLYHKGNMDGDTFISLSISYYELEGRARRFQSDRNLLLDIQKFILQLKCLREE